MTIESPQTEEQSTQIIGMKTPIKDKLTILSTFSAVLAALLSAFVSVWVTSIQTDVEQLVASKQDTIERARLFQELIEDLNSKDKAGYALLTLWKIYQQEGDRQVVVLAALESQNESAIQTLTRLGFQEELEKYAGTTIQNLAISGKGEASKAASNLILNTFSPLQISKYLLDKINSHGASGPYDENVQRLIELVTYNKNVKEFVDEEVKGGKNVNPYIAYVQYRTNEKKPLIKYLKEVKAQPALYAEYIELVSKLRESEFTSEDWLLVTEVALAILQNKNVALEPFIISGAFDVIGKDKILKYKNNSSIKKNIFNVSREYILSNNIEDVERYTALDSLTKWSPAEAVKVIAQHLACDNQLGQLTAVFIEDLLEMDEVKSIQPPGLSATSEQWKKWIKQITNSQDIECNG